MVASMARLVLLYGLLAIMMYSVRAYAAPPETSATIEDIKVAFLRNVTDFVKWPGEKEETAKNQPFVIAILGKTPIKDAMDKVFDQLTIKRRQVDILEIPEDGEVPSCHLLFLSRSVKPRLSKIIDDLKGKPVLIVGDTEGYAQKGVHLNFYIIRKSLKFEMNETAVRATQMVVSYHLFKNAGRIIDPVRKR